MTDTPARHFDRHMMGIALRMGERGLGQTAPNPSVGAVLADEAAGEVIARGWTQPGGRPHAETEAIKRAGARARGATLYVTLEPCAHHGKTPPCADAIIAAGVKRVVVGVGDPDPRTAGQGIARLRAAGIEVTEGICEAEARWLTLGHILRVTEHRPFVEVKLALDRHGDIARGQKGTPVWVTGPEARAHGHLLRARADAILVGAGTVRDDDPELTCRLPGLAHRSPDRVIVDTRLETPADAKAMPRRSEPQRVWIATAVDQQARDASAAWAKGALVLTDLGTAGKIDITALLETLAANGITRLLVEGGPGMWNAFAAAGLVDEAVVYQAASSQLPEAVIARYLPGAQLTLAATRRIGDDRCLIFRRR